MNLDRLRALIRAHEGSRLMPYEDTVGKLTIGVGHNLTDKGISREIETLLLDEDIAEAIRNLTDNLPWFGALDEVRQSVLVDMCFNLGWPRLSEFVNTLEAIRSGQWLLASKGMLASKWARQVGGRAQTLARMMRTGSWEGP